MSIPHVSNRWRVLSALLLVLLLGTSHRGVLRAEDSPTYLAGLVNDQDELPVEGARVTLIEEESWVTTGTTTDATGHFALEVPGGRYRIRLTYGELAMESDDAVELRAGARMHLDFSLHVRR